MTRSIANICVAIILMWACSAQAQPAGKKLIKCGWDSVTPSYIRANIREMEKQPFDGVRIAWERNESIAAFRPTREDETKLKSFYDDLANIEWGRFTDNFVGMITADYGDERMDWFNDEHWAAAEHNSRLVAKAVRVGRCVGITFDPEDYGTGLWAYKKAIHRDAKTFAEYQALVRRRGAAWIRIVQEQVPDVKILFFFFPDTFANQAQLETELPDKGYALFPAFLNGVLEAAGPGVRIINGDESAYYYGSETQYLRAYHKTYQDHLVWVDPGLHDKYRTHVSAGSSVYIDWYFAIGQRKRVATYLTPEQRLAWLTHNVYWSLRTTDEYAWVWAERWHWWNGAAPPQEVNGAIRAGRGPAIDVDFGPIHDTAKAELDRAIEQGSQPRTAQVRRLGQATEPPVIDGRLDDPVWQSLQPLDEFLPPALYSAMSVSTRAWITCDDRALYIAFACDEPNTDKLRIWDKGRDHKDLWRGDVVEILISDPGKTYPFHHFMINPASGYWDSRCTKRGGRPHEDLSYEPDWRRAATIGDNAWYAEAAIPWTALNMQPPKPGASLRANLCRHRHQGPTHNALWSPSVKSFQEADRFGTLVFP